MAEENNTTMNLGLNDNSTEDIASDIRPGEEAKTRQDDKKIGVGETNNGEEMSFFDCSICLDMSKDPIVTCCGHLFCWPCLYRWLHHRSEAKECPVCKAKVTAKNVTPIYGRGDSNNKGGTDPSLKIPLRPHTRRVESWRRQANQQSPFATLMEEMIRRLGNTFDLFQDQAQNLGGHRDNSPERSNNNNHNNNVQPESELRAASISGINYRQLLRDEIQAIGAHFDTCLDSLWTDLSAYCDERFDARMASLPTLIDERFRQHEDRLQALFEARFDSLEAQLLEFLEVVENRHGENSEAQEARHLELLEAQGARFLASLDDIAAMLRPTHLPLDEDDQ